jgi:RNA polymerase sigma-B factor
VHSCQPTPLVRTFPYGNTFYTENVSREPALAVRATRGGMMIEDSGPGEPGTARLTVRELVALDDGELLRIIRSVPLSSARRADACEVLVARYRNLVRSCVLRYPPGPEPTEDLMQVGYIGLLKAINNFDPAVGRGLAAYAQPCVAGEIKRHFRDKRWHMHVERPTQELVLRIRETMERLTQQLGRPPSDAELASSLGVSPDRLRRARMAELTREPWSLDAPPPGRPEGASLAEALGHDDPKLELSLDLQAVAAHWAELPARERRILVMRFYGDMTQEQIGAQLGISQMQISRLLARALAYLRKRILDLAEPDGGKEAA